MVWCEAIAFACVLAAAWPANSLTLWASVLRVGLDLPASFFALYVSRRILRQEDRRFDYGLGKWENLASLVNVPVMFAGLVFLAFRATLAFLNPQPVTHTTFGLVVLLAFGAVNVTLMLRFRRLNREKPAPLVHAQFVLYRNAAVASLLSVLALAGARLAGPTGRYFDILGATILAVLILQSAFVLLRQSLSALLDEAVEGSLQQRIVKELAGANKEYLQLHRIRSRHAGGRIFIELSLEFEPEISVREMLDRSARIRRIIQQIVPGAEVGIQPCENPSSRTRSA